MPRTYRISLGTAAYPVVVSVLWFAGCVWGTFSDAGPLADGRTTAAVSLTVFCLLLGLLPALRTASMTYSVVLLGERQCNFRSMWGGERHVPVQEMTAIDWDEGDIYIRHKRGLVHIRANPTFHDLAMRLLELNPAIITHGEVRQYRDRHYHNDRCSEIRLGDDGTCELETKRRVIRLHVNEIRSVLYWPESDNTSEHYTVYYQGGELLVDKGMTDLTDILRRLKRLNPAVDPPSSSFPYGARSAFRRQLTDRSGPSTQFHGSWLFPLLVGCLLVYLVSH